MAHWRCCGSLVAQVDNTAVWRSSVFYLFLWLYALQKCHTVFFLSASTANSCPAPCAQAEAFFGLVALSLRVCFDGGCMNLAPSNCRLSRFGGCHTSVQQTPGGGATVAERAPLWRQNFRQPHPLLTITSPTSTATPSSLIFVLSAPASPRRRGMLSYPRIWAEMLLTSLASHGAFHTVPLHWIR